MGCLMGECVLPVSLQRTHRASEDAGGASVMLRWSSPGHALGGCAVKY